MFKFAHDFRRPPVVDVFCRDLVQEWCHWFDLLRLDTAMCNTIGREQILNILRIKLPKTFDDVMFTGCRYLYWIFKRGFKLRILCISGFCFNEDYSLHDMLDVDLSLVTDIFATNPRRAMVIGLRRLVERCPKLETIYIDDGAHQQYYGREDKSDAITRQGIQKTITACQNLKSLSLISLNDSVYSVFKRILSEKLSSLNELKIHHFFPPSAYIETPLAKIANACQNLISLELMTPAPVDCYVAIINMNVHLESVILEIYSNNVEMLMICLSDLKFQRTALKLFRVYVNDVIHDEDDWWDPTLYPFTLAQFSHILSCYPCVEELTLQLLFYYTNYRTMEAIDTMPVFDVIGELMIPESYFNRQVDFGSNMNDWGRLNLRERMHNSTNLKSWQRGTYNVGVIRAPDPYIDNDFSVMKKLKLTKTLLFDASHFDVSDIQEFLSKHVGFQQIKLNLKYRFIGPNTLPVLPAILSPQRMSLVSLKFRYYKEEDGFNFDEFCQLLSQCTQLRALDVEIHSELTLHEMEQFITALSPHMEHIHINTTCYAMVEGIIDKCTKLSYLYTCLRGSDEVDARKHIEALGRAITFNELTNRPGGKSGFYYCI